MAWPAFLLGLLAVSHCQDTDTDGDLKRLGARGLVHVVEEIDAFPDPEIWFRDYSRANKAVVIKGGAKLSPAYTLWTDEYFASKAGALSERVVADSRARQPRLHTFEEFLNMYKETSIYMVYTTPEALR